MIWLFNLVRRNNKSLKCLNEARMWQKLSKKPGEPQGPDPREVSKDQMIWSVLGHSLKSERKVAFLLLPTAQNWTALGGSLWRQHMPYLKCLPQSIYWKIYQTVDFKWGLEQVSWALWTSVMVIEMSVSNRDIVWGFWPIKLENYNVKISVWWAKHVTCCIQLSFKD